MNLVVPVVDVEIGPNWANDLNASLLTIDSHTHLPGSGVLITPAAMNINADLAFNISNNAISLRSVRFSPQVSPIGNATDIGCIYEAGVDLYYNDGSGNQIRITQSGSVAGSAGTITGLPSGTASAAYQSGSGTFQFQQSTSTGANLDVATLIVRYPGSYPTPSGNYIAIEAPTSLASGYALTLPALPGQTNVMTLGSTGIISSVTWDQVGVNMTSVGADAIQATTTRPVNGGTTGSISASSSSGSISSTTSTTYVNLINQSAAIVTSGRPVMVNLQPDASGNVSFIGINGLGSDICTLALFRDTSILLGQWQILFFTASGSFTLHIPTNLIFIDIPSAGSHTYQWAVKVTSSATTFSSQNLQTIAYEL